MSWEAITGEAPILPSGGGNADEVRFESGKAKRLRLLMPADGQPYSYLEHCIEIEKFENGQTVRTFRTVRCPKTTMNPNAHCPLCDGQKARRRVRHVCNVWDYEQNKVQKLNAGESVFKPIATARKMGADVLAMDWAVMKTGTDRNDTEYTATNLGPSHFQLPDGVMLFDVVADYAPHSVEEMKAIVESAGGDWNDITTPPALVYPTLQQALSHVMPNGKYKGQTMEQIWNADKSPRGMINFLATKSDRISPEKAAAQVIMVRLGGATIPGVPTSDGQAMPMNQPAQQTPQNTPTASTQSQTQAQASAPAQQTPAQPTQPQAPVGQGVAQTNERQEMIRKINTAFSTVDRFKKGGFNLIIDEMKKYGNGKTNITDFTDDELSALLKACEQ